LRREALRSTVTLAFRLCRKVLSFVNESLSGAKLGAGVLMRQMGTLPAPGESRRAMHETQTRVAGELTHNDGPTFARLVTVAERELGAFFSAVSELFGSEQARLAVEDWLDELELMETLPGLTVRNWRSITIAASVRLAIRVRTSDAA
jgi:hypothetical protein